MLVRGRRQLLHRTSGAFRIHTPLTHPPDLFPFLQYGAYGGIGSAYNFLSGMYRKVMDLHDQGDWQGSVAEQLKINELLELYKQGVGASKQVATIKQILVFHGVLDSAQCAQRAALLHGEQQALRALLGTHTTLVPFLTPRDV